MKGIILAAGKGSRLYPMTRPVCKPLLPVYDKPMIYYPLAVLLEAGIRDILIIIPPGEEGPFYRLLGSGGRLGVNITYEVQEVARGIADALLIGSQFIGNDDVCLVLGDNIFYSPKFGGYLNKALQRPDGACVFGYYVDDPRAFGVVEFDNEGRAVSIEEKPRYPKSTTLSPVCTSMITALWTSLAISSRPHAVSWKSPTSTSNICAAVNSTWSSSTGISSGLMPARRTACSIPRRRSSAYRTRPAATSPARRKSPTAAATSTRKPCCATQRS